MKKFLLPAILVIIVALFSACGTQAPETTMASLAENPLTECPESPNCIRVSKAVSADTDVLFGHVNGAIGEMNGNIETSNLNTLSVHASFGVVFFTDDFNVQITADSTNGTVLHLRSASRVGHSDFGVNGRRVESFLEILSEKISMQ